jgi:hypothetical protein
MRGSPVPAAEDPRRDYLTSAATHACCGTAEARPERKCAVDFRTPADAHAKWPGARLAFGMWAR